MWCVFHLRTWNTLKRKLDKVYLLKYFVADSTVKIVIWTKFHPKLNFSSWIGSLLNSIVEVLVRILQNFSRCSSWKQCSCAFCARNNIQQTYWMMVKLPYTYTQNAYTFSFHGGYYILKKGGLQLLLYT